MSTPELRSDHRAHGIAMMVMAAALWSLHDAGSKILTESYSIFQILLVRSVFAVVPLVIIMRHEGGWARLRTRRPLVLLSRGLLGVGSFGLFLSALPMLPLASAFAILMSSPLFITALSGPVLGERVTRQQWYAVLVGFVSVLVMLRPEGGIPPIAGGMLLLSNVCYAAGMMATRRLGTVERASTLTLYANLVFVAAGAVTAPFSWRAPGLVDFSMLAGIGILAGLAQYCMTQAFRVAPPAVVAPFEYCSLLWAVLLGYLIWHDLPNWSIGLGACGVIGSGLYVIHQETQRNKTLSG